MAAPAGADKSAAYVTAYPARTFDVGGGGALGLPVAICFFFVQLVALPLLFVFVYHDMPTLVVVVTLFMFLGALLPLGGQHVSCMVGLSAASIVAFAFAGLHIYYGFALPLHALEDSRAYYNVYAQQPALAFSGASTLSFAGNVTVDNTRALGMTNVEAGAHTFCVAPVIDDTFNGRVEFWAVGVDCCKNRGDFVCGDAGVAGVHGGSLLSDSTNHDDMAFRQLGQYLAPPIARRDLFLKAIANAEHVHGIVSSSTPGLVQWDATPRQALIDKASSRMSAALGGTVVISLVAAVGLALGYQRFLGLSAIQQEADGRAAEMSQMPPDTPAEVLSFVRMTVDSSAQLARGSRDIFLLGFVAPLFVAIASVVLWTWLRCFKNGDAIAFVFFGLMASVAAALLVTPKKRIYGVLMLFAAVTGAFVGNHNYAVNTFNYCSVVNHRSYQNVPAHAAGIEYQDAGKVYFESSAHIKTDEAVGFRRRGVTYCTAPIVGPGNEDAAALFETTVITTAAPGALTTIAPAVTAAAAMPELPRFDFWAVGVDCCDMRGNFKCGKGAGGASTGRGLVYRDAGIQDELYANYIHSVKATADFYGMPNPKEPILIQWGDDLDALRADWAGKAMGVCMMFSAGAIGFLGVFYAIFQCCAQCSQNFNKQQVQKREQQQWLIQKSAGGV